MTQHRSTPWLIIVGAILGVLAVAWALMAFLGSRATVEVVEVRSAPIREAIEERGMTRLPETYTITMPLSGHIEPIVLTEGTAVKEGQEVARIVKTDLDLPVEEAQAAVDRLEAAIRTNADSTVELTAKRQAEEFVESTQAAVEAARARMESGKAGYDYAESNLGRVSKLFKEGVQTQDDLDRATTDEIQAAVNYRQDQLVYAAMVSIQAATDLMPTLIQQYIARKLLTQAELEKQRSEAAARLDQALENQRRGIMTSPVDGVVLSRLISNERYLAAGTPLLEIGQLDKLEVEADVLSLDVSRAKPGDPVEIFLGSESGVPAARGTVKLIYPAGFTKISSLGVEEQRVKVIVRFDDGDLARLRQRWSVGVGYRVRVRIITAQKPKALVVPRAALFRGSDERWRLFVVRDGRARLVVVNIGMSNDQHVEVTSGVHEGELVVAAPDVNLTDGTWVKAEVKDEG